MSNTISPNMNLVIPTVGSEPGPTYASDINASLTTIDGHTHTSGSGVQLTPASLNINTALNFQGNSAINLSALTLLTQGSAPAAIQSIYASNNSSSDLYYVNGGGIPVQITNGSSVAGTPGSISGLASPASASYSLPTFFWRSNTGIAANLDFGSAIMRNISPNSTHSYTLSPPSAMGSDYSAILPIAPVSGTYFLVMNSSNQMLASISTVGALTTSNLSSSANIVGSQLSSSAGIVGGQIASTTITGSNLVNNTITATQIANATITTTQIAGSTITGSNINPTTNITAVNISASTGVLQQNNLHAVINNTNPPGSTSTYLIRGTVNSDGTIASGSEAFSVSHPTTGIYNFTWTTGFSGNAPSATVTQISSGFCAVSTSSSGCQVALYDHTNAAVDNAFHIIVAGYK